MLIPTNSLTPYEQKEWTEYFSIWFDNLSPHTAQAYASDWRQFWSLFPKHPADVTTGDVQKFVNYLETEGMMDTTIARKIYSLSSFYEFARKKKLREDNPCSDVKKPAIVPYIRATWLEENQITELCWMLKQDTTFRGIRDYALALYMFTTANRRMTVAKVEKGVNYYMMHRHLKRNQDTYTLRYDLKGVGDKKDVKLALPVAIAFDEYFALKPFSRKQPDSAVFQHWDGNPLLSHDIGKIVKDWGVRFGVDLHPHMTRHSATRRAVHMGFSLSEIQDLTGHRNPRSVLTYTQELSKDAQERIGSDLAAAFTDFEKFKGKE